MEPPETFLPYGHQVIEADDIAAVTAVLRSDWLTTGPAVAAFEAALCEATGAAHAVAVSSGSSALMLAARGLGLAEHDAVIVPSVTFNATAAAAKAQGAHVVFADVAPDTGLMTADTLSQALDRVPSGLRAAAVFNVHLNGQVEDLPHIHQIARQHELKIIDDACHALGSQYLHEGGQKDSGKSVDPRIGSCAHCDGTVFSFHPVKTIASGEGGVVLTNDEKLAADIKRTRNHGFFRHGAEITEAALARDQNGDVNPWYYEIRELGGNYRLSDIAAALGRSQLGKLDRFIARRQKLADIYDQLLAPFAPVIRPIRRTPNCRPAWHLYVVLIDFDALNISRASVMNSLRERNIGSQVHFIPLHLQPFYRASQGAQGLTEAPPLPGAMSYYQHCLSLPLFPGMKDHDPERVVTALRNILRVGA